MDSEKFFNIKISMTNAQKLEWVLLPESHSMNQKSAENDAGFLAIDEDGETVLLQNQDNKSIYCFYCQKNDSFQQIGNADDLSLVRLYNIVYSQLLAKGAFYNEREAVEGIKSYAIEHRCTFKEYEDVNLAKKDSQNTFVISWGFIKNARHITYFALNNAKITPPEEIRSLRYVQIVKSDQVSGNLAWLGNLHSIEDLSLCIHHAVLPESLACVATLRTLKICYSAQTSLHHIPPIFRGIKGLRKLVLRSHDAALELPDWLHEFPNLRLVDLRNCRIRSIPYSLVQTGLSFAMKGKSSEGILMENVVLEEGDISLFSQPREIIESYYMPSMAAVKECKVIFLGDGAAGKSSLIERIINDNFQEGALPTDGIKMTKWYTALGEKPLAIRFLDFGGQEIMHSMHRCFLTNHTVYVVVCESRDDAEIDSVAVRWMETVKSFAPECPVILALNKSDLNPNVTVNERELKNINPQYRHTLRTSAKTGEGLEQLVNSILREVPDCLKKMSGNAGFLRLKQDLENMTEDYLKPREFQEKCDHFQIAENLRRDVIDWFQDLGVAYVYSMTFRDVYVLNPAWLTNGIYRLILRTPNGGFLQLETIKDTLLATNIRDIMPDKVYTPEETEFILYVMRKFEISHYIGNGIEMIPMKMEKTPPPRYDDFSKDNALHLRWEGAYLPNNLIHRLMIRKFPELDTKCVWRTGGHFRQGGNANGCEALAEMDDNALDVYVIGARDCRQYMEAFRSEIQDILSKLNIRAEEVICCSVDGREGYIPYKDVINQYYKRPQSEIYIPGIGEYISPIKLLRETYLNWEQEAQRRGLERLGFPDKVIISPVISPVISPTVSSTASTSSTADDDKKTDDEKDLERRKLEEEIKNLRAERDKTKSETSTNRIRNAALIAAAAVVLTLAAARPDLLFDLFPNFLEFVQGLFG